MSWERPHNWVQLGRWLGRYGCRDEEDLTVDEVHDMAAVQEGAYQLGAVVQHASLEELLLQCCEHHQTRLGVCIRSLEHTHTHIHTHIHTHTYVIIHTHMHTHTCIHNPTHTHKQTHTHTQTHTRKHTHAHTCTHTHTHCLSKLCIDFEWGFLYPHFAMVLVTMQLDIRSTLLQIIMALFVYMYTIFRCGHIQTISEKHCTLLNLM